MRTLTGGRRFATALLCASLAATLGVSVAWAVQTEAATRLATGSTIHSYAVIKYNDSKILYAPGNSGFYFWDENDGAWHTHTGQGKDGGGAWQAQGYDLLNLAGTYAGCTAHS